VFSRNIRLGEVKKKAGRLEKEGESIEFWLQPNGLHPFELDERERRILAHQKRILARLRDERVKPLPPITHEGCTFTVAEWSVLLDIPQQTIRNRLSKGWSIERVLGPV